MKRWIKHEISTEFTLALARLNWKLRRFFAVLGIIAMLGSLVPHSQQAYAYDFSNDIGTEEDTLVEDEYPTTTDPDFDITDIALIGEVDNLRSANSKTFQRVDGSFVALLYSDSVHYEKEGKWENIDNTLSFDINDDSYANKANQFQIKFPKSIDDNKSIKLSMEEYSLSWSILGIEKTEISVIDSEVKSSNIKELSRITQEVMYENVMDFVDIQYILSGSKIKENIILDQYIEDFSITFEYSVKNLSLTEYDGGFSFVNNDGEVVFEFSNLFAIDKLGEETDMVFIEVAQQKKDDYIVTVSFDNDWAKNAEYPVKIDPSVQLPTEGFIRDTYLKEGSSTSYNGDAYVKCGSDLLFNYLGYLDFTVPEHLQNYEVIFATLTLNRYSGTNTMYLHELQEYYGDFSNTATFNWIDDKPAVGNDLIDYAYFDTDCSEYKFDITQSVNRWNQLGLTEMPGFEFSTDGWRDQFYSIDAANSPTIEIGYIDRNGMKDYWTYTSLNAGNAGTGYISDFSQELIFVRNDLLFETELQSLGVSFIFNSNILTSENPNIGYGNGWNVSYNISLVEDENNNPQYVEDSTGNKVFYFESTCDSRVVGDINTSSVCYIAEDGSGSELVYQDNEIEGIFQRYVLTKDNTIYNFGLMSKKLINITNLDTTITTTINRDILNPEKIDNIEDESGNLIEFAYDPISGNLSSATLITHGDLDVHHELSKVYYTYGSETEDLEKIYYLSDYDQYPDLLLDTNNLNNVDYIVGYDYYYGSGLLEEAYVNYIDSSGFEERGEEVRFQYYTGQNPKISLCEAFINETKYSQLSYDNSLFQTKISDYNGNYIIYSFDHYGHTVNLLDSLGTTVYYVYLDIYSDFENYVNGQPNYLKNHTKIYESSPQNVFSNPIENNGFEFGLSGWTSYASANCIVETSQAFDNGGIYSLQIQNQEFNSGSVYQNITIGPGIYFFSVDVLMQTGMTSGVRVAIGDQYRWVNYIEGWQTVEIALLVEQVDTVAISLLSQEMGSVYFDRVLIYENENPLLANQLYNSSFEFGLTNNWETIYSNVANILDTSASSELHLDILGNKALELNGKVYAVLDIDNLLGLEEVSNGTISIGAWANGFDAPKINTTNSGRNKSFYFSVTQFDDSFEIIGDEQTVLFDLSKDYWQYAYGEFTIASNCNFLKITLQYDGEGTVLVDGLTAFLSDSRITYNYDPYDRIESMVFDSGDIYVFSYAEGNPEQNQIPLTITDQNGNVINIESEDDNIVKLWTNANVKVIQVPNQYGQVEALHFTNQYGTPYFSTYTGYDSTHQYILSKTDAFGNTSTYASNALLGVVEAIENARGVQTSYEYWDDGYLKRVSIDNSTTNSESFVEYTYDQYGNLTEMNICDKTIYSIFFDDLGRIDYVEVNSEQLMTYEYWTNPFETNQIETQTYSNGDSIHFVYDPNTGNLSEIQFQDDEESLETRYEYHYDSQGKLFLYEDIENNYSEEYYYDSNGNMYKLKNNAGDSIEYSYTNNGEISDITFDISDKEYWVEYYYNETLANSSLYDKTKIQYADQTTFTKDYYYDASLDRLTQVRFFINVAQKFVLDIGYSDFTPRIESLTYSFFSTTYANNKIKYSYLYDELGNVYHETISSDYNSSTLVFQTTITKEYIYDDMNRLRQESVNDSRVDCDNVANINSCYLKNYTYDELGNIQNQKTYKYVDTSSYVVEGPLPIAYEENYGTSYMYVKYNVSHVYSDIYSIPLGGRLNPSFTYYDLYTFPQTRVLGVITSINTSNVDVNTPGYYLMECYAHNLSNTYQLAFGIVVKVGDVTPGTLVKETTYTYSSSWVDQLESYTVFDGVSTTTSDIVYDEIGNPVQITNFYFNGMKRHHAVLDWEGKQLTSIAIYSSATLQQAKIWYSYNDQGMRILKYIDTDANGTNDVRYQYYWSGDLVATEIKSNFVSGFWIEEYQIDYEYDFDGSPIGFKYSVGTSTTNYYYIINLYGDITKIISYTGEVHVEYKYDSWGNVISVSGQKAGTIGLLNSIRYRSYKFDSDIRMYYLNSRYYIPEVGRFLNADGILGQYGDVMSTNLYAYCANNPVMYIDPSGFEWYNPTTWSPEVQIAVSIILIVAGIALTVVSGGISSPTLEVIFQLTGTLLLCQGGGSLVGGVVSNYIYDDFSVGWTSGLVSGSFAGIGFSLASFAIASNQALSGIVAAGLFGAVGNYLGTKYKQKNLNYSDERELWIAVIFGAVCIGLGSPFSHGTSILVDQSAYVIAAIYGVVVEIIIDMFDNIPNLLIE